MKFNLEQLIEHCRSSVDNSNNNISKLTSDILSMDGMSGNKTRHLYNNICSLNNANYLEIGTWKGSSFISAFYKNEINPIVIDNWVEFNGPKEEFISNVNRLCPDRKVNFKDKIYSFPINLMTLYQIWGVSTPEEAKRKLEEVRIKNDNPKKWYNQDCTWI
jgi:hypothetical protein